MNKIPLIVIVGPTAIGKTDLSISIAERLNGEIVSADSMQIYKYMNIGSAKATIGEMRGISHHMIDIINPDEEYSVALYQQDASKVISDIYNRDRLPILVGGTGLYVNSIIFPMSFTDVSQDANYRNYLNAYAKEHGKESIYHNLEAIDPVYAEKIHPNDLKRVIRALEVYHSTGKTMTQYRQDFKKLESPYNLVMVGLIRDRQLLYEKINQRVDKMIGSGLVDEVKFLLNKGYTLDLISMQGLGYKEIIRYLNGEFKLEEAIDILKRDTRHFAKRQITWFKRDKRIYWLDIDDFVCSNELLQWVISHIKKELSL